MSPQIDDAHAKTEVKKNMMKYTSLVITEEWHSQDLPQHLIAEQVRQEQASHAKHARQDAIWEEHLFFGFGSRRNEKKKKVPPQKVKGRDQCLVARAFWMLTMYLKI